MTALADLWPPAALVVTDGELTLRAIDDTLLVGLAELAAEGVHDPASMPFVVPWTRGTRLEIARSVLTYQWGVRSRLSPESWALELAVLRGDELLGVQAISAETFPALRVAESGSWLGRRHHGRGVGTRMRLLVLHLLFDQLGAQLATTSAFVDNPASQAVTSRLGYTSNGQDLVLREGASAVSRRYRLARSDWLERPAEHKLDVRYEGLPALREFLQIT
ncbi:GNAT family N-acetyltransferase [Cellulomonas edaphi]|uniref:GNAT family protein n=1 Tax=Cellulomonas edaphi TaxID=3053468 RepID=A0ABT7S3H4_9CELL|nr:GNAT family protein [Cellulomons edaphi]MDM7830165.1 GNAT family protein [Cellulomons edaphi]